MCTTLDTNINTEICTNGLKDQEIEKSSEYDSSWITKEFLEPQLKNFYKDNSLQITFLDIKSASGKGDGYAGVLLRATIAYKTSSSEKSTSLIIKTLLWDELTLQTQKHYDIIEKEIDMYENVLPKIKNLLVSIDVKGDIFPDTITTDRVKEYIIMEDLRLKEYVMLDRLKGIPDKAHLQLFLKRLAQVHAASAVLYEKDNSIYQNCKFGMFNRVTNAFDVCFYGFWDSVCDEVSRWFGYGHYAEKLKKLRSTFMESATCVYDNEEGDFCVLTHGDMWINNIMFNYHQNNTPKDCVLYDYQFAYFGTPFIDLILFIYSSTNIEVRLNHDEYLQYYHKYLKITLEKLKFKGKIPTLFEFRQQYVKKSFLKLTASFIMMPVMTNNLGDMADLEALLVPNERAKQFRELTLKRPEIQEAIKRLLPVFDRQGLLDGMH